MDNSRDIRQEGIVRKIVLDGINSLFMAITGFGKTRIALMLIKKMLDTGKRRKTIVVVPTLPLKAQWQAKIDAWGLKWVTVETVHTLIKGQHWCNLLILDEVHLYLKGQEFSKIMNVSRRWTLALSATLSEEELQLLKSYGMTVADVVTREEALANGWVENHDIFNLAVPFTLEEQEIYNTTSRNIYRIFEHFDFDFELLYAAQQNKIIKVQDMNVNALSYITSLQQNRGLGKGSLKGMAFNVSHNIKARADIIANATNKDKAVNLLITRFPNIYKMVFGSSTAQADRYGEWGNKNSTLIYHSKAQTTPKRKKDALEAYNTKVFKLLSTVKALNQGFDADFLQMGIVAGGTASNRTLIQRLGRIIRKSSSGYAAMVFVYMGGSVEERKVLKAQNGLDVKYLQYNELEKELYRNYGIKDTHKYK